MASPGGRGDTAFRLVAQSEGEAVFENLEHDFPQRIRYTLRGDALTARVEDASGAKGIQWTWKRSPAAAGGSDG